MQVSLREFELVVATLELGTLSAAADALNISQPAASKLLKTFEDRIGLELFRRESKKLIPTADAYDLFPELSHVIQQVGSVMRRTEEMKERHARQIEIVTNPAVASNIMPGAVELFADRYSQVRVVIRTRTTIEIQDLLTRDQADLGVVYDGAFDERLHAETLSEERIGCLLHPDHPLASRSELTPAALREQPIIALGKTQPVGAAFRRLMRESAEEPRIAIEVSQSNTACGFVARNLGIAVLDAMGLAEGEGRGLVPVPLSPAYTVRLSLVRSANRRTSRPVEWMTRCIQTYARTRPVGPSSQR